MARLYQITHQFVEHMPATLQDGVVYISIGFGTVVHKCCCGCGDKVVTPLTPVDWTLAYNGQTISLTPSIGRWGALCQSHYWIRNGRVEWSSQWSRRRIQSLKQREEKLRDRYFGEKPSPESSDAPDRGADSSGWIA